MISFLRKKTSFNDLIFADPIEYTKWVREYRIHFFSTNEVQAGQVGVEMVQLWNPMRFFCLLAV